MHERELNLWGALAVVVGDRVREALVAGSGLDHTAVAALLCVGERPGGSTAELAAALGITHSGTVRTVDRLLAQRLLSKRAGRDGRSNGLCPTAAGRRLAAAALTARREALAELMSVLPERRQAAVSGAVEQLLAAAPQTRQEAWRICRTCEHDSCRGPRCPVGHAVTTKEESA